MNKNTAQVAPSNEQTVVRMTLLTTEDYAAINQVVFSKTPGHLIDEHPRSAKVLRRIGEDAVVRDYLATFARTEKGARRVLMLTLGLARMAGHAGPGGAAALSVAAWCALSLGRWAVADNLALRSLSAAHNTLAERVREMVAGQWFADLLEIESDLDTEDVRRCSARVVHELTETRVYVMLP